MLRVGTCALAALLLASLATGQRRALAPDSPWATESVTVDSGLAGPTVVIVAGMHGDEPAGACAAEEMAGWTPTKGRLVLVPHANVAALKARQRYTPGQPESEANLNRLFPQSKGTAPVGALGTELWKLVVESAPALVIDLHEGYDFTATNGESVGSSVIAADDELSRKLADAMVAELNASIEEPARRFARKGPPVAGSLARSASTVLGVPALIVETTTKGQALAVRVRQQRVLVARALRELGMLAHGPHVLVGTADDTGDPLAVALYVDTGVTGDDAERLHAQLSAELGFLVREVCAADVRDGVLAEFDVVVFPGGSGSAQARALGDEGRERVRSFVQAGGGYFGISAGAYLASNNYPWSLHVLDADVIDREHWQRGRATLEIAWSEQGRRFAAAREYDRILYVNGPLLAPAGDPDLPDFETLATFRSEVAEKGAPKGLMAGTPAIVRSTFGKGRVVCSSPHPEQSEGLEDVTRALVRAAAGRETR